MTPTRNRLVPRLVTAALAVVGLVLGTLAIPSVSGMAAAAPADAGALTVEGLTTNGRVNPLGIPGADPTFGWQSTSERRGVTQTAYELQVGSSANAADVWTTGKVESAKQSDVAYDGPALTAATRYYWRVRVWDDQGNGTAWSEPSWFETGLLTADDWGSAAWIGRPRPSYASWTDYTVTARFKLNSVAFGTFLRATDVRNAYMWQINVGNSPGAIPQLIPHRLVNGAYTALAGVNLSDYGFTRASLLAGTHTVSYALDGTTITTTLDGQVVDTRTMTNFSAGRVGVRTFGAESVSLSRFKVTRPDGTVLADPEFGAISPFGAGTVANGEVTVSGGVDALLTGPENNAPLLRKTFETASGKTVESARVYASAHGVYELSLNGRKVGDQFLAPGYTEYEKRILSQTYDVTDLVQDGANGFGAEVGDGWWAGKVGLAGKYQYGQDLALVARLKITYTDGTIQWVDTDTTWKWGTSPYVATDNQIGETYNARYEQPGWNTASFDDTGWAPVVTVASDTAKLSPQPDEPVRRLDVLDTHAVTTPADGVKIYDLGQNMVGVPRVTISGTAGETVKIRHAEVLNPDGTMYVANLRAALATDYYTFGADGTVTYQPKFTQHGFRYIEISGLDTLPAADDVKGVVLGSDLPDTGHLTTSNPMLNQLLSNVRWGARGNFLSIPTDTPARDERLGWTGDINVFGPTASYLFDTRAFLGKWMQDVRDEQKADGQIPAVVPSTNGAFGDSGPGWQDAIVTVPYALYRAYDDLTVVRHNWAGMLKFYDFAAARIGNDNLGAYGSTFFTTTDWLSLDNTAGAANEVKTTAIWADTVRMLAELAEELDDPRAEEFANRYTQIKKDFVKAYVAGDGTVAGGSQTGYAMALGMDLIDDSALQRKVGAKYVANLAQHDNHLQTGFIGTPWLLPALSNIGRDDLAYTMLLKEDYPSWGYEIRKGATTIWERWNSIQPDGSFGPVDMNSFNHYAYGAVADWMHQNIGGIRIGAAGYRSSVIEPHPGGGLTSAHGELDTVYGTISSAWKTSANGITIDVTVPVNTTSQIRIPADNAWAVTEAGAFLDQVDGVRDVTYDDEAQRVVVTVGSGRYSFTADDALAPSGAIMTAIDAFATSVAGATVTPDQLARLKGDTEDAADSVRDALTAVLDGDDVTAEIAALHDAQETLTSLRAWLPTSGIAPATAADLDAQLRTIVRRLGNRISSATGITVTMNPLTGAVSAGDMAHGTISVENHSGQDLTKFTARVEVPDLVDEPIDLAGPAVVNGGTATVEFDVRVPNSALVGSYDATADVALTAAGGATYEQSTHVPGWVRVGTAVTLGNATVTYPKAGQALLAVPVTNAGTRPVSGRVEVTQPAGWPVSAPSALVTLAPGATTTVQVPVYVKRDADPGNYPADLAFVDRGATVAVGTAPLQVASLTLPPTEQTSDYVDFGNATSENAHGIQASATSGTSSEAGFTRRYSHNNTPGSWYSAAVAVPAGTPFLLRVRETWNTAGVKDYNVYVDGELLKRVNYAKTGSGGVTEYQLSVTEPSMLDNDGKVTVKFEYPSDNAPLQYYDPSIADLWAIPAPDTLAPTASAFTGANSRLGDNGWFRGPAQVSVDASDDLDPDPAVEYRTNTGSQDWSSYTDPVTLDADGRHTFEYRATDAAGNTTSDTLQVDVDATKPNLNLGGGPVGSVKYGSVPAAPTCDATDATSGVASCVITGYGVGVGEHTVTATATDAAGNVATVSRSYTVVKGDQVISIQAPDAATFGDPEVPVAASSSAGLPVALTAAGSCRLTSAQSGSTLRMTGAGRCTLTASQEGDGNYNAAHTERVITVGRAGQTINLDAPATATFGDAALTLTAAATSGLPVTLTGSGACTVTGTQVRIIAAGECRVTASQGGNEDYNPAPDAVAVIAVGKAGQSIALTAPAKVAYGIGTINVSATATSGLDVTVTATGACTTVGSSGAVVRVTGDGRCVITATQSGDANYEATAVEKVIVVDQAEFKTGQVRVTGKARVGRVLRIKATFAPKPARVAYTWYRNGKRIAGAKGASYRVRANDRGDRIWVKATARKPHYRTYTVTSTKVRVSQHR